MELPISQRIERARGVMPNRSNQQRRIWKLRALKAFARKETMPLLFIGSALGEEAFDTLLNEAFLQFPGDPDAGAEAAKSMLYERHGERLRDFKP